MPTILSTKAESNESVREEGTLLAFKFQFDSIFAQNQLNAGFKNYRQKSSYLIRADLIFKNANKSRSLFLFDNRTDLQDEIPLMDAELLPIDKQIQIPNNKIYSFRNFENDINFQDSYSNYFSNQQVRTAQFKFIDRITSDSYVYQMKKFNIEPFEIRSLLVDENGLLKQFPKEEVDPTLQMSLNLKEEEIVAANCYQKNSLFIHNCKIIFNENYNTPNSKDFASGYVVLPIFNVLDFDDRENLFNMLKNINEFEKIAEYIQKMLQDQLTINIYAQPVMDTFECEYPFDIIFSNRDNILIQKNFLASK
jgi:hypothetical protein